MKVGENSRCLGKLWFFVFFLVVFLACLATSLYGYAPLYYSPHESMDTTTVVFSPDGKYLLSAGFDGDVRLWETGRCDLQGIAFIHAPYLPPPPPDEDFQYLQNFDVPPGILSIDWSPDGKRFVIGKRDRTIRLFSLHPILDDYPLFDEKAIFHEHVGGLRAVAYSPDGEFIASAGHDEAILLWNVEKMGSSVKRFCCHSPFAKNRSWIQVNALDFSLDGKLLVSSSRDGTVKIWEISSGKELRAIELGNASFFSVKFSPNGNLIAASTNGSYQENGSIFLWNVESGKEEMRFQGHNGSIWSIDFSPDGRFLASGGLDDGKIIIWELSTGKSVQTLIDQGQVRSLMDPGIRSLSYSPDGRYIVSGVTSGPLPLWDVETGKIVREFGKCPEN